MRDLLHSLVEILPLKRPALDEARDQAILERRRHFRSDAEPRGRFCRQPLGLPIDAQKLGVFARLADDVIDASERRAKVAVGDAAIERVRYAAERAERR